MQRLIAFIVIAIALSPNTGSNQAIGAELGLSDLRPNSDTQHEQNFDGNYSDQPGQSAEHKMSKNAEKIMTYMARVGMDSSDVKHVANYMNSHVDDNNEFRIAGGQYKGFTMQFTHEMAMPSANKFKLRFTNEEMPHWGVTGSTKGLMLGYKLQW